MMRLLSARAAGFDSVLPSGPDIAQFKQGVKTVAGKMAVLANGVMNTIQVSGVSSVVVRLASCVCRRLLTLCVPPGSLRLVLRPGRGGTC